MKVSRQVLARLEWPRVLDAIAEIARTPMGVRQVRSIRPLSDVESIEERQQRVEEMRRVHAVVGRMPIPDLEDPAPTIERLAVRRTTLRGQEIYALVQLLKAARDTVEVLRELDPDEYEALGAEWARFPDLSKIIDTIDGNVTPAGNLEDHASPELARLRREVRQLSDKLTQVLESFFQAEWTKPVLRDHYITVRNDRYVVPVRTDTPRRFPGIVHGSSATDKTVFVEPMETVEINNRLMRLREEEAQEIERILRMYTEALRAAREPIEITAERIGEIDRLESVATWADRRHACRPKVSERVGLFVEKARHPLLEDALGQHTELIPLDVDLPRELHGLVISGPNAGGKTVALKTLGLLAMLAHAGLPVLAQRARFPLSRRLMADIGDEQSIQGGLSTFSSHVRNLAQMVQDAEPGLFALIDEIGTGTDPAEGAALGMAVLERLLDRGVHVIATTHHQAIKTWTYRSNQVANAAMQFDEDTLRPTYRLVQGVAGSSIGLTMAEQLGLDAEVVANARGKLDPAGAEAAQALDSVRELASDLQNQREALTEERREMEAALTRREIALEQKYKKRLDELETRLDKQMKQFRSRSEALLGDISEAKERRILAKERARRERELREEFSRTHRRTEHELPPRPDAWSPQVGEEVVVASLGRAGKVRRVQGDRADVELGRAVFTLPAADLRPTGASSDELEQVARRTPALGRGISSSLADRDIPFELKLVGLRVEEARDKLDKYLDDACLAGLSQATIVHGIGTGKLKKSVREQLSAHADVETWRPGAPEEGGEGVTVIRFRDE